MDPSWALQGPSRAVLDRPGGLLGYLEVLLGRRGAILDDFGAVLSRRKLEKARMRKSKKRKSMIFNSSGLAGGFLGALLSRIGGFLVGPEAILGHLGAILGRL